MSAIAPTSAELAPDLAATTPPPVSCAVVIPVHNKPSLTIQVLDRLLAQADPHLARDLVVVDDGSTDTTPQQLTGYAGRVAVITNSPGKGFAGACNVGVAASRGEFVVLLNNDTIPTPGWLGALVAYATAHPAAGIVGAKLLFPDNTIQHAGVAFGFDRYPRHLYIGFPGDHPAVNVSRPFQAVTGACMLIRRALWDELGGFDLAYRNGWEDVDLCLRARAAGHEVHYCHDSVVYHLESVSRDIRAPEERANRERFVARWHETIQPDDFAFYVADGLVSIRYQPRYPLEMRVSPRVAGVVDGESVRDADRLLAERAKQVSILLRNNIVLNTRVQEAEQRMLAAEQRARDAYARLQAAGLPLTEPDADGFEVAPAAKIIGSVEQPGQQQTLVRDDTLPIVGWALSPYGIGAVTAHLDDEAVGTLRHGLPRPDVAAAHPGYPNEAFAGFAGAVNVAGLTPGDHKLTLRIADRRGQFADAVIGFTIAPPDRVVAVCEEPRPGARAIAGGRLAVTGWAIADSPLGRVVAELAGLPPVDLRAGEPRPDLQASHGHRPEADRAGFSGEVALAGLAPGTHHLRVTITTESADSLTLNVPISVLDVEAATARPAVETAP